MKNPEEIKRDTLTKKQAFEAAQFLVSKPLCAINLTCEKCPFGCIEGLSDCVIVSIAKRLEELKSQ